MIKITVLAVGGIKEKFFDEAINEYQKRISRFAKLSIIEVSEESKEENIQKKIDKESEKLLSLCRGFVILTDRAGKDVSSEELATQFDVLKNEGVGEITFIIGGSNGVNEKLKEYVSRSISFGRITFPHQLFRVVLLEQIYRAFTISAGLPYHK